MRVMMHEYFGMFVLWKLTYPVTGELMSDGKKLEALVAFVERQMLPEGFSVETNSQIRNEDGTQIAEFDVQIRGRLGTTDLAWLIECRDRPSSGAAPGSWIEQLVGRRSRFGFNKVTAVSTTGFAEGAREYASQNGIELRVVEALTPESFSWLGLSNISFLERRADLHSAKFLVNKELNEDIRMALKDVVMSATGADRILKSTSSGNGHTAAEAFLGVVEQEGQFEGVEPGDEPKKVEIYVKYLNDEDHFVVDTNLGQVRIEEILFEGQLSVFETLVPVEIATKYRKVETGETISQIVTFAPHEVGSNRVSIEFHRMGEDGRTYVGLRRVAAND
jgi:hypothetical protein